ncbi:flagellar basal-body rod protein FlgG [Magnetospirillum gryphiswaldense]|uniref:Flagellar basal-body rod protein FlgG n=2 Tax=Magnetospirillum gryphiswaldense TaxID=55518 RepID=V6F8M5_MAGGM|nr:flagellar basal-body rod protein FlgG [Magnetospirillum gryphiswaldense]AVM75161.1 Flagellar basal-body rod protein FlgG [Magnetospirillum gryphiswaldense MSR-1]AVM79064.1 Flagellar basal-body rod protein FlgG [Magnetospirillum gryphiswaldense]CAM74696.1 flagellar basal body distal rod protein; FlgG [Magnetospirillum gryphiswaldense MSR-1]CDL00931.1 flagellar component of cell-distal portion of basal-body rod [Magnetospirillum gryphiswaldense MSR-1 v2]
MRSLNIAATGMLAQQTNVEVISNNIANMNTTAYTKRRPEFSDLLYQNLRRVGAASSDAGTIVPTGVQLGLGVKTTAVYRITEQGSVQSTDNTLDVAIQGKGYLQIRLPSGDTAYTRDGSFQLSEAGQIVTHEGYTVLPGITVPNNAVGISINASGQVMVKVDGSIDQTVVGQLQLANFANEAGLEARGDNLFLETPASGGVLAGNPGSPGYGTLLQGFLETSNVNVVAEVTNLISAQRAYEMNSKVIQTSDEMMSTINQLK